MSPSRINWGVVLILVGGTLLATNLDYLSNWVWWDLLRLWPVLLIAIGIDLVFRRTKLKALSFLSTLLLVATFAYVIWLNGGFYAHADYGDRETDRSTASVGFEGQTAANVRFVVDDGRVYYNSGTADLLRMVSRERTGGIGMAAECNASSCDILVTEVDQHWLAQLAREHNAGHRDWRCYLHPRVDYSLDFDLDNTEVRFFAEDLVIRQMNIKADYSDLRLKFGSLQQETRIDLKGRTCDVELFLPQAAAIRLAGIYLSPDAQSVLGLTEHEGALFTDDYATAAVRFDVVADLDNSDVVVKRY